MQMEPDQKFGPYEMLGPLPKAMGSAACRGPCASCVLSRQLLMEQPSCSLGSIRLSGRFQFRVLISHIFLWMRAVIPSRSRRSRRGLPPVLLMNVIRHRGCCPDAHYSSGILVVNRRFWERAFSNPLSRLPAHAESMPNPDRFNAAFWYSLAPTARQRAI